jgi:predicted esterase
MTDGPSPWRVPGAVIALLVGATGLGAAFALGRHKQPQTPAQASTSAVAAVWAGPPAEWCPGGFDPLPGDACLASPPERRTPPPIVLYLHGRYARDAATDEVDRQGRLAARATARGFAVLALRGRIGACRAPELATWYCWPSNAQSADGAAAIVETWRGTLAEVGQRLGSPPRRFVLGFSNGGYFAGLLAVRGLFDADAFVIAHGGPVEPVRALRGKPPLLLLSADDDVAQDDMIRFDEELTRELWAHDSYARSGGHGLTDQDIDAALMFFMRAEDRMPLDPPLSLHRAVRHSRDAAVDNGPVQPDDAGDIADEGGAPAPSGSTREMETGD